MKFRASVISAIFFAAFIVASFPLSAQPPRGFTYQGLIEENGVPITGNHTMEITIADSKGNTFTETFQGIAFTNGIFNIVIGGPPDLPPAIFDFNSPVSISVVIDGVSLITGSEIWAAPYAINSETVNGMQASPEPIAGELFPVPLGTGYTGTAKLDPAFLPNSILASSSIATIDDIGPAAGGNFTIAATNGITVTTGANGITLTGTSNLQNVIPGNGLESENTGNSAIVALGIAPAGITSAMLSQNLQIGTASTSGPALTVADSETNGGKALLVRGGIAANNATGPDGNGLNPGSPQTFWADQITVPSATGTTLQIYNVLINATSTIVISPYALTAAVGQLAITAQASGTFSVSASTPMGTGNGGVVTGLNYMIVNH